ncbi:MAG: sigma-70 family RNA polymerase sigma factor [Clostridia bacterium]|nr:sigma-70 family RNA polymerase sigma factor [Clostridia bacterium]
MERAAVPSAVREERLRRWIDEYAGAIERTCFISLNDRALAQDAAQDTFWKAWRHMEDFERKGIENEKAWLLRIAVNTCADYRRSAWFRHEDRGRDVDTLPALAAPAEQESSALILDVCRLPDRYRQAVLLYFYHNLTLQETAQVLRITKSTVHRRLRRACEMLKDHLPGGEHHAG